MPIKIIAVTQRGISKEENEDRIIVGSNLIAEGIFLTQISSGIIAVADGVGGNSGGATASHFIASQLVSLKMATPENFKAINEALLALSSKMTGQKNMASTLSGISVSDEEALLFSIGNTRVYLLQGRKYLKQITTDDTTLNYLLTTGQISDEDLNSFNRKNEITACFGGGSSNLFDIKFENFGFLTSPFLITSDGIHDHLSIDTMEDIISEYGLTASACETIISSARTAGSMDDASIVLGIP